MATTAKLNYSSETAITCTISSISASGDLTTSSCSRQSNFIDNTSTQYLDALVRLKITVAGSGTLNATPVVYVYAYGASYNVGAGTPYTNFTDGVSGTDGTFTITALPTNLKLVQVVNYYAQAGSATANGSTIYGSPFSIAQAFGGSMPAYWGIVVNNQTGVALASGSSASFVGISVVSV